VRLESESEAWDLDDAEERHRNAPDIYSLPEIADRTRLRPGDRVELLFLFRGRDQHGPFLQSERLPVNIHATSNTGYVGALEVAPRSSGLLSVGDCVLFEARHVCSIRT
jgi:hypothetical protein